MTDQPISDALDAIHAAGGKAWDDVLDPDAKLREMRGELSDADLNAIYRIRQIVEPVPGTLTLDELVAAVDELKRQRDLLMEGCEAAIALAKRGRP